MNSSDSFQLGVGVTADTEWSLEGRIVPGGLATDLRLKNGLSQEALQVTFDGPCLDSEGLLNPMHVVVPGFPMVTICHIPGDPDEIIGETAEGRSHVNTYRSVRAPDFTVLLRFYETPDARLRSILLRYSI